VPRRPYRVEISYPKRGKPRYFLAKDVIAHGRKLKVKKYICSGRAPTLEEAERFRREFAYEMESKAAAKKASISSAFYESDYLSPEQIGFIDSIVAATQKCRKHNIYY